MTTDFRALCAELVEKLDEFDRLLHGAQYVEHPLTYRARAALTEPEPEGPTPQPVPVAERLPGPEDCDAEGRCWWFHDEDGALCSHWLPAHALPVPE